MTIDELFLYLISSRLVMGHFSNYKGAKLLNSFLVDPCLLTFSPGSSWGIVIDYGFKQFIRNKHSKHQALT